MTLVNDVNKWRHNFYHINNENFFQKVIKHVTKNNRPNQGRSKNVGGPRVQLRFKHYILLLDAT